MSSVCAAAAVGAGCDRSPFERPLGGEIPTPRGPHAQALQIWEWRVYCSDQQSWRNRVSSTRFWRFMYRGIWQFRCDLGADPSSLLQTSSARFQSLSPIGSIQDLTEHIWSSRRWLMIRRHSISETQVSLLNRDRSYHCDGDESSPSHTAWRSDWGIGSYSTCRHTALCRSSGREQSSQIFYLLRVYDWWRR
jgi:hypothetical protein